MKKSKRTLIGTVVRNAAGKTAVVAVERVRTHPRYLKQYLAKRTFKCHDEENRAKEGDTVLIEETRPLSREKRWRIVKVIKTMTKD